MLALKAHVENGRIVVDEPVNLPDGTQLRVLVEQAEAALSGQEREELARALEAFEPGDFENATAFAARLAAKPRI
jgi:hypothetical protein